MADSETLLDAKRQRGALVSKLNDELYPKLERLLLSHENIDSVNTCAAEIAATYDEFKASHGAVIELLSDAAAKAQFESQYDSVTKNYDECNGRVAQWLSSARQNIDDDTNTRHSDIDDSASVTSLRAREALRKARLAELRIKQIEAEHALQRTEEQLAAKQRELQRQQELLRQRSAAEAAQLEGALLDDDIHQSDGRSVHMLPPGAPVTTTVDNGTFNVLPVANEMGGAGQGVPAAPPQQMTNAVPAPNMESNIGRTAPNQQDLTSRDMVGQGVPATMVTPQDHARTSDGQHQDHARTSDGQHQDHARTSDGASPQHVTTSKTDPDTGKPDMNNQSDVLHRLASVLHEGFSLPKPELFSFSGDALSFTKFMNNFKLNIENKVHDNKLRLNYLIQYCNGEAKELIEDCVNLRDQGYERAVKLLSERYGKSYQVVQAYVHMLTTGPIVRNNDVKALMRLSSDMSRAEMTLSEMGFAAEIDNSENMKKIVARLPSYMKSKWVEKAYRINETGRSVKFKDLYEFVLERAMIENSLYGQEYANESKQRQNKNSQSRGSAQRSNANRSTGTTFSTTVKEYPCRCCGGKCSRVYDCNQFKSLSLDARKDFVMKNGLCRNCFIPKHMVKDCRKRGQCEVSDCGRKHHTLLHDWSVVQNSQNRSVASPAPSLSDSSQPSKATVTSTSGVSSKVFLRILPVKVINGSRSIETYALLDNGSDVSLVHDRLVQMLGIRGRPKPFVINSVNCTSEVNGLEVDIAVRSLDGSNSVNIRNAWSVPKLPISLSSAPSTLDLVYWPHLSNITIPTVNSDEVMLLIGSDTPEAHWSLEERRGGIGEPCAIRSLLGWTVQGPSSTAKPSVANVNFQQGHCKPDDVKTMLHHMWNNEFNQPPSNEKAMSLEDKQALKIMKATLEMDNGHYKMGLPWAQEDVSLPDNRVLAKTRLDYLKKKFKKDDSFQAMYTNQINEYLARGYAEPARSDHQTKGKLWYIPHHGVTNVNKPGKVRVVFDAAAKYRGHALNDHLLQGPDLVSNLVGVLIRFRQEPIAIVSDIEGMFHQVKVLEADRGALRFLWWRDGDPENEICEYQMNRFVFGAKSSPSCAAFALRSTAQANKTDYDDNVINTVLRNFYVDDLLKSTASINDAVLLSTKLRELLHRGGFRLTKWISNSREVIAQIPKGERAPDVQDIDIGEELPTGRALGVRWNINKDSFTFHVQRLPEATTRRQLLSVVASLYDPLGLVAPSTLFAKQLLQKLCKEEYGWDDVISSEDQAKWAQWCVEMQSLSQLNIPRCFKAPSFGEIDSIELHVFSDASTTGYGACCYLRLKATDTSVHTSLVLGKSRVAPTKAITVPRMELAAAVTACQLYSLVNAEIEYKIERTVFWTDSAIVLAYIKNTSKRFKTYVANRVASIHEVTEPEQWRHVPTKQNPADLASRGVSPTDRQQQFWLCGPAFLKQDEATWPSMEVKKDIQTDDEEVKKEFNVNTVTKPDALDTLFCFFSIWFRLVKAVAQLLRFELHGAKKYLGHSIDVPFGRLTVQEFIRSSLAIVKYIQRKSYANEIGCIEQNRNLPRSSPLARLCPIIVDGLLRVGGRLCFVDMPFEMKHQLIIPGDHPVATLIVRSLHISNGHIGPSHLLSLLREKYWIVGGSRLCRKVTSGCFQCKRIKSKPMTQQMASLPVERLTPDKPPFTFIGIDFFGPFFVKSRRVQVKRYGCLITCLTTRAVHLEVTHSLDTDSFLMAISRFVARRGRPETIFSDNGTNLTRGCRELKENISRFNQDKINDSMLQKQIEWKFHPPNASHMGGIWERMIRSVRTILMGLCHHQTVTDEVLVTLFTEIEAILNSRPITGNSSDIKDPKALTPNHLLLLRPNGSFQGSFNKETNYYNRRWKQVHHLTDIFWRRWVKDYIPSLQIREKWQRPHASVAVDDVVLIVDSPMPRGRWPIGVVTDVNRSKDGLVRSCKVRTASTVLVRPIHKLCLLERSD